MPLSPGDKLGPYEILAAIGKGGMGEVYCAHDPRLQRDVAIKVSAERFNERFEREARAVAALNHPNICQVYDVGPNYLVMELIEGPTLGDIIKNGPVPIDEALRIADQIGEALAAAHEKRITHRDLKPGNVKVKDDGVVKVLDFGLAKIGGIPEAPSVGEDSPTMSMTLTQHGMILGTASYMAPEQAKGKAVDARADIWAFGVVLYEMLTAQRLFKGEDLGDILASVVKEVPDLSLIPAKARRLVQACLEKDPRNRLQAIGDRKLLLTEPQVVQVSSSTEVRRQWLWPVIAGVVTLAAMALSWTHFREQPPALQTLRYQLARPEGADFRYLQMSPDGRYIAYAQTANNTNNRLHVWALDALEERDFPGTEGTTYPFFSPDSSHIGFFAQGKLKQVAVSGGPATNIADAPDPRGGTWGADGTIVFTPTVNGGLSRVASAGGTPVPLKLQTLEAGTSLRYPVFLDESDRFLYFVQSDKPEIAGAFAGSLGGMAPVRVMENVGRVQFVALPGSKALGHLLFRRDATLMAQPFDTNAMKTTGDAFPVADQIPDAGNVGYGAFAAARNGTLVFVSGGPEAQERELVWLDREGKPGKSVVKQRGLTSFALAPNGVQVLFEQRSITGADLWLHDIVHGATQRFTFDVNPAQSPVWSPDSSRVAFGQGTIAGPLYQKATQASAKEEALGPRGTNITPSSWSPDGKLLAYSVTGDTTRDDIWLLPMEGDRKPRVFKQTPFSENSGMISPDGRWMMYVSFSSGQAEVYLEPMPSGGAIRQISVGGGRAPAWRADGRELYYLAGTKLMAVDVNPSTELMFGTPHELFTEPKLATGGVRGFPVSPSKDGSRFMVLRSVGEAGAPPLTVVTNWQSAYGLETKR